jgi:hypothetical protein
MIEMYNSLTEEELRRRQPCNAKFVEYLRDLINGKVNLILGETTRIVLTKRGTDLSTVIWGGAAIHH